jgi:hypothetical protein
LAISFVVNIDGRTSLDGGCDGHSGFRISDLGFQISGLSVC